MQHQIGSANGTLALLAPHEPSAFRIENESGRAPILFTCDHASRAVPRSLGTLGLAQPDLQRHIAWDPGAAELTLRLAERFDAPAVLTHYSRLVIDCNREPRSGSSIPADSDGTPVPGNLGLTQADVEIREATLFKPYHDAIAAMLQRMRDSAVIPAYIAMHTFTPRMNGHARPWHFGVLWERDTPLAEPLMEALKRNPGIVVGDNEPYSALDQFDFSRRHHASSGGLPYALLEIREDLIANQDGMAHIAALLGDALESALGLAGHVRRAS